MDYDSTIPPRFASVKHPRFFPSAYLTQIDRSFLYTIVAAVFESVWVFETSKYSPSSPNVHPRIPRDECSCAYKVVCKLYLKKSHQVLVERQEN